MEYKQENQCQLWHPWQESHNFDKNVFQVICEYEPRMLFSFRHYAYTMGLKVEDSETDLCKSFVCACEAEDVQAVEYLYNLLKGKDLSIANANYLEEGFNAACTGNLSVVEFLLLRLNNNVCQLFEDMNKNPVDTAIIHGNVDIVKCLLSRYDPHEQKRFLSASNCEKTHKAVVSGSLDMVQYLVGMDAKCNPCRDIVCAATKNSLPIIEYIMSLYPPRVQQAILHQTIEDIVRSCAIYGFLDIMRYALSSYQEDVSSSNYTEMIEDTLVLAASHGHLNIVQYLFSQNLIQDQYSKYEAMFKSIVAGRLDIVRFLLSKGVAVDHNDNQYPRLAVQHNKLDILKLFVSAGLNVTDRNNELIHMSLARRYYDIFDFIDSMGVTLTLEGNGLDDIIAVCQRDVITQVYYKKLFTNL